MTSGENGQDNNSHSDEEKCGGNGGGNGGDSASVSGSEENKEGVTMPTLESLEPETSSASTNGYVDQGNQQSCHALES